VTTIKITAKRQATFPSEVCDALGVKPGDHIALQEQRQKGERVWVLKPVRSPKRPWLFSLAKYAKNASHPWTRERDGDATALAWAKDSGK
jgi:bifunctional DNA-binding transcriptional regulator/antitoxin component of YhaV-PrlF toxin-antitoxin module